MVVRRPFSADTRSAFVAISTGLAGNTFSPDISWLFVTYPGSTFSLDTSRIPARIKPTARHSHLTHCSFDVMNLGRYSISECLHITCKGCEMR